MNVSESNIPGALLGGTLSVSFWCVSSVPKCKRALCMACITVAYVHLSSTCLHTVGVS
jgi:hypothetical protein